MVVILLLVTGCSCAAALGCRDAPTAREAAICRDDKLAELDGNVTRRYVAERAELSSESAELIRQDQRNWLIWLEKVCPAHAAKHDTQLIECLTTHIKARADGLSVTKIVDVTIFSRCFYAYGAGKPREIPARNDLGFGEGAFCWPQIDTPNPSQREFNRTALVLATSMASKHAANAASDFAQIGVSGSEQSIDYSVVAANGRLIELTVSSFFFGHGAAHPLSTKQTLSWWLDSGRELNAADIFQTDKEWVAVLAPRVSARLKANEDYSPVMEANVGLAVTNNLKMTHAWTISNESWSLCFNQYEIAVDPVGMPCATFIWDELAPLLNPALKPETLPPLKPEP